MTGIKRQFKIGDSTEYLAGNLASTVMVIGYYMYFFVSGLRVCQISTSKCLVEYGNIYIYQMSMK